MPAIATRLDADAICRAMEARGLSVWNGGALIVGRSEGAYIAADKVRAGWRLENGKERRHVTHSVLCRTEAAAEAYLNRHAVAAG